MPRERVKHGKQYATWSADPKDPKPGDATEHPHPEGAEEVVYAVLSKDYDPGDPGIPAGAKITEDVSLDVNWNREAGWVQVSMSIPAEKWDEINNANGDLPTTPYVPVHTDIWTRQEINGMIKTLRRARDAAFGADE